MQHWQAKHILYPICIKRKNKIKIWDNEYFLESWDKYAWGGNVTALASVSVVWTKTLILAIGSVPVETYSRNWFWPRSIFIIGSVWRWNWYCTHINSNNVILWGIIPICKVFAKTWHFLFCFGVCYSFWPFALTRECALHLRPCEKMRKTYFAGGLAGFSKTICTVPE